MKKKKRELDGFTYLLKTYMFAEQIGERRECSAVPFHPPFQCFNFGGWHQHFPKLSLVLERVLGEDAHCRQAGSL